MKNPLTILSAIFLGAASAFAQIPDGLTTNLRVDPIGVDANPRLSWNSNMDRQGAYQIQVSSSSDFSDNRKIIWKSGRINSSDDLQVPYNGPALQSNTRYYWRVQCFTSRGKAGTWSRPAYWETGILDQATWDRASWIGGRQVMDNDWTDMTETVHFRITDPAAGIKVLFHAKPVGGSWSDAYVWELKSESGSSETSEDAPAKSARLKLVSTENFRPGDMIDITGEKKPFKLLSVGKDSNGDDAPSVVILDHPLKRALPKGSAIEARPEVQLVQYSQSAGGKYVLNSISVEDLGGVTAENLSSTDIEMTLKVDKNIVTTLINGKPVDTQTINDEQLRMRGTIGFGKNDGNGSGAIIRSVSVRPGINPANGGSRNSFSTDFHGGWNPMDAGEVIWSGKTGEPETDGLRITSKLSMLPVSNPEPRIRKEIDLPAGEIERARLYVATYGYHKLSINGKALTADGDLPDTEGSNVPRLMPDEGNIGSYIYYNTFDVTDFLRAGSANALGIELSRGWAGVTPMTKAILFVSYENGSSASFTTDRSWKYSEGPIRFDSIGTGEKYDARVAKMQKGWDMPGFNDAHWTYVTMLAPSSPEGALAGTRLRTMENGPVMPGEVVKPVEILETEPGSKVYLFRFPQKHSGFVRVQLKGLEKCEGLSLRIRTDEEHISHYQLSDDANQVWEPGFHLASYDVVEVMGLENILGRSPSLGDDIIVSVPASCNFPANEFHCSNAELIEVPANSANDVLADAESRMIKSDVSHYYRQLVRSMAYSEDGKDEDALFEIPWNLYRYYGDVDILAELYPFLEKSMADSTSRSHARNAGYMARIAAVLGKVESSEKYKAEAAGDWTDDFCSNDAWLYQGLAGIMPTEAGYRSIRIKPLIPYTGEETLDKVSASIESPRGTISSSWENDAETFVLSVTIPGNTRNEIWVPAKSSDDVSAHRNATLLRKEDGYVVYSVPAAGCYVFKVNNSHSVENDTDITTPLPDIIL